MGTGRAYRYTKDWQALGPTTGRPRYLVSLLVPGMIHADTGKCSGTGTSSSLLVLPVGTVTGTGTMQEIDKIMTLLVLGTSTGRAYWYQYLVPLLAGYHVVPGTVPVPIVVSWCMYRTSSKGTSIWYCTITTVTGTSSRYLVPVPAVSWCDRLCIVYPTGKPYLVPVPGTTRTGTRYQYLVPVHTCHDDRSCIVPVPVPVQVH